MAEHPNATLARQVIDALNRGDNEAMANALADDVEWHEIGRAEPIRGKAALAERFMGSAPDFTITGKLHDVVANDDHTIALVEATAQRGGRTFVYRTAEIMHLNSDGKITGRWAFSDDTAAINEFFA